MNQTWDANTLTPKPTDRQESRLPRGIEPIKTQLQSAEQRYSPRSIHHNIFCRRQRGEAEVVVVIVVELLSSLMYIQYIVLYFQIRSRYIAPHTPQFLCFSVVSYIQYVRSSNWVFFLLCFMFMHNCIMKATAVSSMGGLRPRFDYSAVHKRH